MISLTQFSTHTPNGLPIHGEYEGNDTSGKVVIFVHGFGVRRDSRGLFNQIGGSLKGDFLIVRFDFLQDVNSDGTSIIHPYSRLAVMLDGVMKFVREELKAEEINVFAHSMGCLISGTAHLERVNKVILACGPPVSPYTDMKKHFSGRPGTILDEDGESIINMSDGAVIKVPMEFWPEVQSVQPLKLYEEVAKRANSVTFIRALNDHVIGDSGYEKS